MENFTNPIDSSKLTPMEQELILGRANSDSIAPETNTADQDCSPQEIEDFVKNYKPESLKFGN